MTIFEITIPGAWIDHQPGEWRNRIETLIKLLKSRFFEANDALDLFNQSEIDTRAASRIPPYSGARRQHDWENYQRVLAEVRKQAGLAKEAELTEELQAEVAFQAPVRLKREQWEAGMLPQQFSDRRPIIYARTFLLAVDGFERVLCVLSKGPDVPDELTEIHAKMRQAFPDLRGVRNSAQHMEDRALGLGERPGRGQPPKPLDLKPIDHELLQAPDGGVLVLESLLGSKFTSTMADGTLGQLDISIDSLKHLHNTLNEVLGCFKWAGPKRHLPR